MRVPLHPSTVEESAGSWFEAFIHGKVISLQLHQTDDGSTILTHIEPAFRELAGRANSDQLQNFVSYIENQWMNHPIFDIPSWSVFEITVRTNNDTEGWHNRLNQQSGNQSLSFYRLVPALLSEAELVAYELGLVREGSSTYEYGGTVIQMTISAQVNF